MARSTFDNLRAWAIATQALGFVLILTLETLLGDAARPWQGWTLAAMIMAALWIALVSLYRRNRQRKALARRLEAQEDD
jgi:membrane protein DedA with SNARE-associated domain